jgi:hypothetical protein
VGSEMVIRAGCEGAVLAETGERLKGGCWFEGRHR